MGQGEGGRGWADVPEMIAESLAASYSRPQTLAAGTMSFPSFRVRF